jgi:UPF0716 family protein affecting phage T7 exclusion
MCEVMSLGVAGKKPSGVLISGADIVVAGNTATVDGIMTVVAGIVVILPGRVTVTAGTTLVTAGIVTVFAGTVRVVLLAQAPKTMTTRRNDRNNAINDLVFIFFSYNY